VMIYIYDQLFGNTAGNPQYGSIGAVSVLIFILLFLMTLVGLRVTNLAKES
jgi:ABC-type sugar transport system permease subunit